MNRRPTPALVVLRRTPLEIPDPRSPTAFVQWYTDDQPHWETVDLHTKWYGDILDSLECLSIAISEALARLGRWMLGR